MLSQKQSVETPFKTVDIRISFKSFRVLYILGTYLNFVLQNVPRLALSSCLMGDNARLSKTVTFKSLFTKSYRLY